VLRVTRVAQQAAGMTGNARSAQVNGERGFVAGLCRPPCNGRRGVKACRLTGRRILPQGVLLLWAIVPEARD